jgi:hypothetical protein
MSDTVTWTPFELECGTDIQWKEGEESFGDFVIRKNEVCALRRDMAESQRQHNRAMETLPWSEYTHFASTDGDEGMLSELYCMRCVKDPKISSEGSVVIETYQEDMDKVVEAMLKHEYEKHGGRPCG